MRALPNLITLARLLSGPLLVWLLLQSRFRTALAVTLLAGLTDWLDGFTARRLNAAGNLGIVFDPLADKTLLVIAFVALGYLGRVPAWLLALVIGRDLIIVIGVLLIRWLRGIKEFRPSLLGKISTFFQILYLLFVLCYAAFPWERLELLVQAALACCAIFTTLSGIGYIRQGIQMARVRRELNLIDGAGARE